MTKTSRSRSAGRGGNASAPGGTTSRPAGAGRASGTGGSRNDATGASRRGRRERDRVIERSFLERYRLPILGVAVVAAIVVLGAFVLSSATTPAYACSAQFQPPASADPSNKGVAQDDLGRSHVPVGQTVTYPLCPPASGNHSIPAPLDIGLTDASRRTPDMPLYTLRNKATGETVATTDPGRALITGKWADVGRFKGPVLRGVAARPPYFHNGSAADLGAVVDFYNQRFGLALTPQERSDLVAFLRTL